IRMNRDTLYSIGVVDISQDATITLPDGGNHYMSVMVVNQDHYINRILHQPGDHTLTGKEFESPWVAVAARVLVDPADADDVATVNALQDQFRIAAKSSPPFRDARLRHGQPRRDPDGAATAGQRAHHVRSRLRHQDLLRSGASPARNRVRLGWTA